MLKTAAPSPFPAATTPSQQDHANNTARLQAKLDSQISKNKKLTKELENLKASSEATEEELRAEINLLKSKYEVAAEVSEGHTEVSE